MSVHSHHHKTHRRLIRLLVVAAALAVGAQGLSTAPAQAAPPATGGGSFATLATIARAHARAADQTGDGAERTPEPDPEPAPEPVASAELEPDESAEIEATPIGATVTFGAPAVREELTVAVTPLAEVAAASAESETAGTAVGTPFEVTATNAGGAEVTSFPNDVETTETANGPDVVTAFTAGVSIDVVVPAEAAEGVDRGSLRLYTREGEGLPWTVVPSYYDAASGTVKAELDHLSEFVVIGEPFDPDSGPRVVLDPDDDLANTIGPGGPATELPYNQRLADEVAAILTTACRADVVVTRTVGGPGFVSKATRAGMAAAHDPAATVTLAFDALVGGPWGVETDGGTKTYSRGGALDNALFSTFRAEMPGFTGRPERAPASALLPYSDFDAVPGAYAHLETLYLDHNFDRPVIDDGFTESVVGGVAFTVGTYLESQGFDCTDPATGGLPKRPSAAQLARWKHLGFKNYQAYGADPVSFSTGNLLEDERLFSLTGVGEQELDFTLVYNSQDGRLSRIGAGWSFGPGARAQRFDDGSVLVVRGDGGSDIFEPDGVGGYVSGDGVFATLSEAADGRLELTGANGELWTFDASGIEGIGELVEHRDRQGNRTFLTYGEPGEDAQFLPLASITDEAGQRVSVGTDQLGRVTSFTHPDGRGWSLEYNEPGDLVAVVNPDGRRRTFSYDEAHLMLSATDAAGVTYLQNAYDGLGRVVSQWDADGNNRKFIYNDASRTTTYVDNEGGQTTYAFDEQYRVLSVTDPAGQQQRYAYDENSQVVATTDEAGRGWNWTYDSSGNMATERAPDGSAKAFTYTPNGELVSMTDDGGADGGQRTTLYEIDARGLTTVEHRPDGSAVTYTYDARGDRTSATDPMGGVTTFGYDGHGNLTSATDPLGRTTSYRYDGANRLVGITDPAGGSTSMSWDSGDRLVSTRDAAGGVTTSTYDANDHLLTQTDPDGAVTSYSWDNLFRLVSVSAPDGAVTQYRYNREDELTELVDPLGNSTTMTLDALYRPVTVVDPNGGSWQRSYDPVGNLVAATDPRGATTRYSYDGLDRQTSMTDPSGATWTTTYDGAGRAVVEEDPLGATVRTTWDSLDRITSITDQEGFTSTLGYNPNGNVVARSDRRGNSWTSTYDAAGQLLATTDPLGGTVQYAHDQRGNVASATDEIGRTTTYEYDALSRMVRVVDPSGAGRTTEYDPMGRPVATIDPNGHRSTIAYDPVGRVTATTDSNGNTTTYSWDLAGRQVAMIDGAGSATTYGYDPAGQLLEVVEGAGASVQVGAAVNVTTGYTWDASGNLTSISDANGHVSTFSNDLRGLVIGETDAIGTSRSYSYDGLGRLTDQVDAKGQSATYTYTARSDVERIERTGEAPISFTYDADQARLTMLDGIGVSTWDVDVLDRTTAAVDGAGAALTYGYDPAGQLTEVGLPSGDSITYEYDPASRPSRQATPWGSLGYAWDAAGNLTAMLRSSGLASTFEYDAGDRLTKIRHESVPSAAVAAAGAGPAAPVAAAGCTTVEQYIARRAAVGEKPVIEPGASIELAYAYDGRDAIVAKTRADGDLRRSLAYSYDPLGRLVSSRSSAPENLAAATAAVPANTPVLMTGVENEYTYDPVGNRIGWETSDAPDTEVQGDALAVTSSFNEADQLVSSVRTRAEGGSAEVSYGYDANGNRATQRIDATDGSASPDATTYRYTADDRLAEVIQPGRTTEFAYDGLGRALSSVATTTLGQQVSTIAYDGLDPIEVDNDQHGTTALVRDALGELALQSDPKTGEERWQLVDLLGSTIAQAVGGSITQLADYSDWGVQSFRTSGWDAELDFTGELSDPAHDQIYFHARTYDPMSATWLQKDPARGLLQAPQTLARYAYVTNNPIDHSDAYGNWGMPKFVKKAWNGAKNFAKKTVSKVTDWGGDRVEDIRKKFDEVKEAVQETVSEFKEKASQGYQSLKQKVVKVTTSAARTIKRHADYAAMKVKSGIKWISEPANFRKVAAVVASIGLSVAAGVGCGALVAAAAGTAVTVAGGIAFGAAAGVVCSAATGAATRAVTTVVATGDTSLAWDAAADPKQILIDGVLGLVGGGAAGRAKVLSNPGKSAAGSFDDAVRNACSFSGSTEVLMGDGTRRPISEIEVGDRVWAEAPETGQRGSRAVLATLPHTDRLLTLRTSAGEVVTTEDHPFWNATDHEWQESLDLDPGDQLLLAGGGQAAVEMLDWSSVRTAEAWDLTVEDLHTYFVGVGAESALVHNCDLGDDIARALDDVDSSAARPNVRNPKPFANDGRGGTPRLPEVDGSGRPVSYTEHTVNPRSPGQGLDGKRLITGSDGSVWATTDHMTSWTQIR